MLSLFSLPFFFPNHSMSSSMTLSQKFEALVKSYQIITSSHDELKQRFDEVVDKMLIYVSNLTGQWNRSNDSWRVHRGPTLKTWVKKLRASALSMRERPNPEELHEGSGVHHLTLMTLELTSRSLKESLILTNLSSGYTLSNKSLSTRMYLRIRRWSWWL